MKQTIRFLIMQGDNIVVKDEARPFAASLWGLLLLLLLLRSFSGVICEVITRGVRNMENFVKSFNMCAYVTSFTLDAIIVLILK